METGLPLPEEAIAILSLKFPTFAGCSNVSESFSESARQSQSNQDFAMRQNSAPREVRFGESMKILCHPPI
jgi:hypothetical protein